MALSVMNFGQIRDLVSNLGWKEHDNTYTIGVDCLDTLESIEKELLHEDIVSRNVHIALHICGTVKKDLIPILLLGKNDKILSVATRILLNLSLPVEYLSPVEDKSLASKCQNIRKQLILSLCEIKKAFLNNAATFCIVAMLREAMIKVEKHNVPLFQDDCIHLKNCLLLLRNILHIPEELDSSDTTFYSAEDWQSVRNKLIWNLFVQGLDGALLLMLNSKYRDNWTVPLALVIALIYRNQNIVKVHETLEFVSSASETSADEEESDCSKNSSVSLSSESSKAYNDFDSGCALVSDSSAVSALHTNKGRCQSRKSIEKVQISDDSEPQQNHLKGFYQQHHKYGLSDQNDSENSSCFELPHHKKVKRNVPDEHISLAQTTGYCSKEDSGLTKNMECISRDEQKNSSGDDLKNKKSIKNFSALQNLRSLQMYSKISESDSSNEGMQNIKVKYRSHPPTGHRGKSPRRNSGCTPTICIDSAIVASTSKDRVKYPLWEKRNSVTAIVDINSTSPSDEDIRTLIKKFTLSFLHGGFSHLVQDIMNLLFNKPLAVIDKSVLFWILGYFLHLAALVHISLDHVSYILGADVISYLIYECVIACENIELNSLADIKTKKSVIGQLSLAVTALKEIMVTIDLYHRKSNLQKNKTFFSDLFRKLSDSYHFRHLTLLLLHNCNKFNSKHFSEDVIVLNHYILMTIEKGVEHLPDPKKISFFHHLKHFSSKTIINFYGTLLENYKYNSNILNECLFTMMHHIAGDLHASDLLIEPSILKTFSNFLKEDTDLEPYQEDLVMYILNKFSLQVQKRKNNENQYSSSIDNSTISSSSITSNYLLSEEDYLFWGYLQFEQDKDPISRISEHIPTLKQDIFSKLQLKGIISSEKCESLEIKMETVGEKSNELPCEDLVQMDKFDDEITHLLCTLVQSGCRQHLTWLQDTLLDICFVKLGLSTHLPEPIPFYALVMETSVPLIPYTEEQRQILRDDMFLQLLKKMGFSIGIDVCPMYPRIPLFWTAEILFTMAARLGPMRKDKLKFSYEELLLADISHDTITTKCPPYPKLPPLSSCCSLSSWLIAVQQSKDQKKPLTKLIKCNI